MREERSRGQENEKTGAEGGGGFMFAVMQKCKHFAALAENNDTAGRGRCERFPSSACVRACVRGRARQRHRGERKEKDGGEMRRRARRTRRNLDRKRMLR